jgi:hypothetical protein
MRRNAGFCVGEKQSQLAGGYKPVSEQGSVGQAPPYTEDVGRGRPTYAEQRRKTNPICPAAPGGTRPEGRGPGPGVQTNPINPRRMAKRAKQSQFPGGRRCQEGQSGDWRSRGPVSGGDGRRQLVVRGPWSSAQTKPIWRVRPGRCAEQTQFEGGSATSRRSWTPVPACAGMTSAGVTVENSSVAPNKANWRVVGYGAGSYGVRATPPGGSSRVDWSWR